MDYCSDDNPGIPNIPSPSFAIREDKVLSATSIAALANLALRPWFP